MQQLFLFKFGKISNKSQEKAIFVVFKKFSFYICHFDKWQFHAKCEDVCEWIKCKDKNKDKDTSVFFFYQSHNAYFRYTTRHSNTEWSVIVMCIQCTVKSHILVIPYPYHTPLNGQCG